MRLYSRRAVALTQILALPCLLLALAIGSASAADVSLEAARLSIASIDGSARLTKSFTLTKGPEVTSPEAIDSDEVLRVAFTLKDVNGGKLASGTAPHQVVMMLQDSRDPSLTSTSIIGVKPSSGKASWSQRIDRLPQDLVQSGSGSVDVSLLLGFFGDAAPVKLPLITLQLPSQLAAASRSASSARESNLLAQGFRRHVDHHHTFNVPAADQMPPVVISLAAALLTLALPVLVFAGVWTKLSPGLSIKSPSSATLPFLSTLAALEALALVYWNGAGMTLFKMLPWLVLLSIVAVVTGRNALTEMRRIRLGKKLA